MEKNKTYLFPVKKSFFQKLLVFFKLRKSTPEFAACKLKSLTLKEADKASELIGSAKLDGNEISYDNRQTVKLLKIILKPEEKIKIDFYGASTDVAAEVVADFFLTRIRQGLSMTNSFSTLTNKLN